MRNRAINLWRGAMKAVRARSGATPSRVVDRSGPARLLRFGPDPDDGRPPLLLVAPIINRARILDLLPGHSVVGALVEKGRTVHLLDWGRPAGLDRRKDFDWLLRKGIGRFVRRLDRGRGVDCLGYCLGGTLAVCYAALEPNHIRRLVTLNGPVDFSNMDLLGTWTRRDVFPVERLIGAFGNMPASLIQSGFWSLRPVQNMGKWARAWKRFNDPAFASFFTALEFWNNDGVDVFGAAYRTLIRDLYRENRLVRDRLQVGSETVRLAEIRSPVLIVTSARDHICPPEAALALRDRVGGSASTLALSGGHVGAVVGKRAKETLVDPLEKWLNS